MNLSDWKQAAQRSAATEKLQLVIAQRSTAQRSAAQRSVCVNGPLPRDAVCTARYCHGIKVVCPYVCPRYVRDVEVLWSYIGWYTLTITSRMINLGSRALCRPQTLSIYSIWNIPEFEPEQPNRSGVGKTGCRHTKPAISLKRRKIEPIFSLVC